MTFDLPNFERAGPRLRAFVFEDAGDEVTVVRIEGDALRQDSRHLPVTERAHLAALRIEGHQAEA